MIAAPAAPVTPAAPAALVMPAALAAPAMPAELYHRFVAAQPAEHRDEVGRLPVVVVLGERARGGQSALVEAGVAWRDNMRLMSPSLYDDAAPVRFYRGVQLVAVELSIAAVDDETAAARDGLAGLFGELGGRDISAVVVAEYDTLDPGAVDVLVARAERIRAKLDLLAGSIGAGVEARLCIVAAPGADGFDVLARVLAGARRGVPIEVAAGPPAPAAITSALAGVLPHGLTTLPGAELARLVGFLARADGFASALAAFLAAFATPAAPPHTARLTDASLFISDGTLVGAPFSVLDRGKLRPAPGLSWRHVAVRCLAAAAFASLPLAAGALAARTDWFPTAPRGDAGTDAPRGDAGTDAPRGDATIDRMIDAPLAILDGTPPAPPAPAPASATPYYVGFDMDGTVSASLAAQRYSEGYRFCVRYVSLGDERSADLTTAEVRHILGAGLALMPVQHVNAEGWMPTKLLGTQHGQTAAANVRSVGVPPGVNLWLDLEGVNAAATAGDVTAYANAWFDVVSGTDFGFVPGIYVGANAGLTSQLLHDNLRYQHYWKSLSSVPDVAKRGYQMVQSAGTSQFDINRTQDDHLGGRVRWLAPGPVRYPTIGKADPAMAGAVVGALQLALNAAGHQLAVDQIFSDSVESAVKAFQSANGLAANGIASDATWAALSAAVRR